MPLTRCLVLSSPSETRVKPGLRLWSNTGGRLSSTTFACTVYIKGRACSQLWYHRVISPRCLFPSQNSLVAYMRILGIVAGYRRPPHGVLSSGICGVEERVKDGSFFVSGELKS
ncbi:hypothetical protein PM082_018252 [Marasmius tenuissimus]|nr:hypothetical protein PM082_018252 [Marasmius tenuissimus]